MRNHWLTVVIGAGWSNSSKRSAIAVRAILKCKVQCGHDALSYVCLVSGKTTSLPPLESSGTWYSEVVAGVLSI